MRIGIIGAGPGGLYLARLLRLGSSDCDVHVFERNAQDSTFGFGVAFSEKTLTNLLAADETTHDEIIAASVGDDGMGLRHRGRQIRWPGFGLSGIARAQLLGLLQRRALEVGAEIQFNCETVPEALAEYDVVVAADGASSLSRGADPDRFGTSVDFGQAKYMWVGTAAPFDRTTFCVRQNEAGTFAIHAYPYAPGLATLVIETDLATWERARFGDRAVAAALPGHSDEWSARYLEAVFEEELEGQALLLNNSKWLNFPTVRNERWHDGNLVLLGDSAHTAHPSVASGTKMAMEDAIVLAEELIGRPGQTVQALAAYEARRRPDVEHVQARAELSRRWWETLHHRVELSAEQLSFSFLTRAGAVGYMALKKLAPELTDAVVASLAPPDTIAADPLTLPLDVGGTRFEDRLLKGSDVIRLFPINADDAGASVTEVAAARRKDPSGLLGAEFPIEMIGQGPGTDQGEEALLALAENLRRAGCDIVALPPVSSGADWERRASLGERLRCEVGLACLGRWEYQDLDRATTDLLAGRCDLIELVDARSDAPTHLAVMRA